MIEVSNSFLGADGLRIVYRRWLPADAEPRAIVMIVHGLGEHSGRYRHVAAALTEVGFVCYGIDHRGHGESDGARAYIPDGGKPIADLAQLVDLACDQHNALPTLLFGHSMGSLIGLGYALRHPGQLRALALSGVAIHGERAKPAWLVSLCLWAARYLPKLRLSPPGSPSVLTRDEAVVRQWWADPLTDKGMWRIGTSAALVRLGREICTAAPQLELPLLALHGADDRLVPESGAHFLRQVAGSSDITVRIYPGCRHELVNEINREEILHTLRDWLLERA